MRVFRMRVHTGFPVRFAEFCERFVCRRPCEDISKTAAVFGQRRPEASGQI